MAIVVTHTKVSTIPDGDDSSLIRPSDWNETHTLSGLGTMAEQNANAVAITGGTISGVSVSGYVPTTTTITAGTGLTGGGDLSANRTFALANTAVTTGTYGNAARTITQTVDQQGRLTNIFDQPIEIAYTAVTGLGTAATKDAGAALGVATLDAGGKVPASQIPLQGDLNYQGTWNATTNSPTLTSSVGTKGYYYVVDVAGTTNLNGITDWQIGDWAIFNGTVWQKVDNTDAVTSVNGFTGTVVLTTTNVAEGTNLYYTDARARASISAGTGLSYNSTTGAMNFSNSSVATWAATPSSANLALAMTDETGSGSLVFGTAPTLSAPVIDGANPYIQFNNGTAVAVAAGRLWYDGTTGSWNAGMGGGNITQQIGEEIFVYGKASASITEGQLVAKTGVVGASGQITFGPAPANLLDNDGIIGVATENITVGNFGRVTYFGVVHGLDTTGSSAGQTWADGDTLYYNTAGSGLMTNVKPVAPYVKYQIATVIHAGNGGSGSLQVNLQPGTTLGGTDNNVQLNGLAAANLLTYSTTSGYWKNTALTAGTGITVGNAASGVVTVTNSAPDQTVALTGAGTTTITGTYPNFTITSNDSKVGTVTSVGGTGTVSGISLSGTVTTSGNLTLSGTLDLSSPPVIGNTTANLITGTTITATKFVGVSGGTF